MSKDLWFAEFERHLNDLEDEGIPFNVAYENAAGMAEKSVPERLADLIDQERMRRKDERQRRRDEGRGPDVLPFWAGEGEV